MKMIKKTYIFALLLALSILLGTVSYAAQEKTTYLNEKKSENQHLSGEKEFGELFLQDSFNKRLPLSVFARFKQ